MKKLNFFLWISTCLVITFSCNNEKLNTVNLDTDSQTPELQLKAASLPTSYYQAGQEVIFGYMEPSIYPYRGHEKVGVIQDFTPWYSNPEQHELGANVHELKSQGIDFCIINSKDLEKIESMNLKVLIISSAQHEEFYYNLFPKGIIHPVIEAFVKKGGILSANLYDYASGPHGRGRWEKFTFIAGLQHRISYKEYSNDNYIYDPEHPIITGECLPNPNGGQIVDNKEYSDLDGWNSSSVGSFIKLPEKTKVILMNQKKEPVMIEYPYGDGLVIASLTSSEWRYQGGLKNCYPQNLKLLANDISYQVSFIKDPMEVEFDIKPQSCPNPLNVDKKGLLPVAILGTSDFDVTKIDVKSITFEGIAPIHNALEDVSTPVIGRKSVYECTTAGPDGYEDLTLKFKAIDIINAIGDVSNGEIKILTIKGCLEDGTPFIGRDCVVIRKN